MCAEINDIPVEIHEDASSPYRGLWNDFFSGTWEPETVMIFKDFIKDNAVVVDAGAAVGITALLAATCAKNVRVIAIEPARCFLGELKANISGNPALGITLFEGAIADFNGEVRLEDSGNHKLFSDMVRGDYAVEAATLPTILEKTGVERVDFFKIDIEGGEYRVLPACVGTFRKYRPTVFISLHPSAPRTYRSQAITVRLYNKLLTLMDHARTLYGLSFYRYLYLQDKRRIRVLAAVLGAAFGRTNKYHQLVFTDREWR
jgi:FkbM family methyltransferase